jgi:hypothetical protein
MASRKAAVVTAVSSGVITIEGACHRYRISEQEFLAWQRAFENYGIVGLRVGYVRQRGGIALPDRPPRQPFTRTPEPHCPGRG